MPDDGDVISIPLEIVTTDVNDLHSLEREIADLERRVEEVKPKVQQTQQQTRRNVVPSSGAPIQTPTTEEATGIFRPTTERETLPTAFRDKKSRQAFVREDEFAKLRQQLQEQQERTAGLSDALATIFGVSLAGGAGQNAAGIGKTITSGINLSGFITRILPPLVGALMAFGVVKTFVEHMLRPGGIYDKRFKRDIAKEVDLLLDRATKNDIRQGFLDIRVTTTPGLRVGTAQVTSTKEMARSGTPLYDINFEAFSKGVK